MIKKLKEKLDDLNKEKEKLNGRLEKYTRDKDLDLIKLIEYKISLINNKIKNIKSRINELKNSIREKNRGKQ